jgi:amino acid adenylation domain-containing protein
MKQQPLRLLHETLLEAAAEDPEKTAIVADGKPHTYRELLRAAQSLAHAFQERGLKRGDRVAIYLENGWPCVVAIYATLMAGGAFVVVNPQTRAEKLQYLIEDSGAAILVLDGTLLGGVPLPAALATGRHLISVGPRPGGWPMAPEFDEVLTRTTTSPADPGTIPLDLAALIYTSGSTGQPKGVMMTHQSMLFAAGSIAQYLRLSAEDRILNVLPLAFDYGLYQLLIGVYLGATLVLEQSFTYPAQVLERARTAEVTVFPGVPTIFATLRSLRLRQQLTLPSVRRVTNTAAALPTEVIESCREIFPNALIFAMYGLTECKRVSYLEPEELARRPTSVGKAIPGTEVFLLSVDGQPVPPGEPGILHVRGPHLMLGYWGEPELSARMLKPGHYPGERMLCTQDYFRVDDEGFLYFVGRTDDIIKTRGEKVSPVEVEAVLHSIPGVREAAVVGEPDELLGQAIHAFIVAEEGATLTARAIRQHCRTRLEAFMVPQEIFFLAELPRTATAKVRKEGLRSLAGG